MDTEKSSCSAKEATGSVPRIMNGFSIECILAKPDRIAISKSGWTPRSSTFPRESDYLYAQNANQDYGKMCKDNLRATYESDLPIHGFDLNRDGPLERSADHQQPQEVTSFSVTSDSSSVHELPNATGSEDGDYGSEESGCKLSCVVRLKITPNDQTSIITLRNCLWIFLQQM